MMCCQFIFRPGTYDEDFHHLDQQIDAFARGLEGFQRVEHWKSPDGTLTNAVYYFADAEAIRELARFPMHLEAKSQVDRWYDGYQIVISEITSTYGNNRLVISP